MNHVALYPLNIISLCTGGAGLDLGFELAVPGARTVCMVEREAFAAAHLVAAMQAGLLAQAPVWSDARTFNGRRWRGLVDGIIGGIPCQPHSLAGKRLGEKDERDLWSPTRRIIVQSGAWWVLIENVPGMLSAAAGLEPGAFRVWRDLQRLGFQVEGGLFRAAEVGAPHERERLFILAVADARCAERWPHDHRGSLSHGHAAGRNQGAGRPSEPSARLADTECDRRGQSSELLQPRAFEPEPSLCGEDLAYAGGARWDIGSGPRPEGHRPAEFVVDHHPHADVADANSRRLEGAEPVDAPGLRRRLADPGPAMAGGANDRQLGDPSIGDGALSRQFEAHHEPKGKWQPRGPGHDIPLFPPGPDDHDAWRSILDRAPELEPAVRRMADGVATGLGPRVDELRMLGNGVVPLEAGYAIRTLVTRLAARGSAGAALLARMMEEP